MKCQIPEISWHNRDPVLSVDIQPKGSNDRDPKYRLASGGTDSHVLIWYMLQNPECGTITLDLAADLTRHQRAVNAVRWSPSGELLATADDESVIFIWKQKGETETLNILDSTSDQDKETWLTLKILRGHMEDVYDLSWSANSQFLISGSVDNTAIVWDVARGKNQAILQEHKGFVQGVAWDPKNKYLATLSTDRNFRVYDVQSKRVVARCTKCTLPVPQSHPLRDKTVRLFHDDTLQTFFRRLSFSPDGNLIVTPSGVAEIEGVPKPLNTTYIFTRNSFKQPAITLPSPDQYTVAVRFCPVYFQHRPHSDKNPPIVPLPYRMVFAVATKSSVYLYDTQQATPFAVISNIHYTRLTDMSWSSDGKILIVSSTDGFCSLIFFSDGELGTVYVAPSENAPGDDLKTPPKSAVPSQGQQPPPVAMESDSSKTEAKPAQPIAFRKKPKQEEPESVGNATKEVEQSENDHNSSQKNGATSQGQQSQATETDSDRSKFQHKPAQPIAFRKKPKQEEPRECLDNGTKDLTPRPTWSPIASNKTVQSTEVKIVIENDKIISSDEKFESPAKKDRPVTPIAVRRHPRTPTNTPTDPQPSQSSSAGNNAAKPIAVRRHPRVLLETMKVESTVEEDANDTWPIDEPKPSAVVGRERSRNPPSPMETDLTEDIVLIVESDGEDEQEQPTSEPTKEDTTVPVPNVTPKTPRRVEFRTISTPKSKKKL